MADAPRFLTPSVDKDGLAREDSIGRGAEADRVMYSHPHSHDDDFLFEQQRDRSNPWRSKPWFRTVEKTEVASPDDGEPTVAYQGRRQDRVPFWDRKALLETRRRSDPISHLPCPSLHREISGNLGQTILGSASGHDRRPYKSDSTTPIFHLP